MTALIQTLDGLYYRCQCRLATDDFLSLFDIDFHKRCIHDVGLSEQYRLAARETKKLHDEIMPMLRFLRKYGVSYQYVRMSLSDGFPDATLTDDGGRDKNVEITVANARERRHLAIELNSKEIARGFIGVDDDRLENEFQEAISNESIMYTAEMVETTLRNSIAISLRKKAKYKADILLVSCHRFSKETLSLNSWEKMTPQLASLAAQSGHGEVFLVGGEDGLVHRLK